jgi:hypothetical protein
MAELNTTQITNRSRFALGVALASLISIFAFAIPITAYLCEGLLLIEDYPGTKASQLVIAASPWLPVLIAVLGSAALLMKEARISAAAALKWNRTTVIVVVLIGGFILIVCIIPMAQFIFEKNDRQWW